MIITKHSNNDYQQFLANFEWFLALFQISDVKPELSLVELKVSKNGIFWAKTYFKKLATSYEIQFGLKN